MKRYLFLDDSPKRHDWFIKQVSDERADVDHAWSYRQALTKLYAHSYDEVWLDHDLHDFYSDHDVGGDGQPKTGLDLVKALSDTLGSRPRFVVHSWNTQGAVEMAHELVRLGYDVTLRQADA